MSGEALEAELEDFVDVGLPESEDEMAEEDGAGEDDKVEELHEGELVEQPEDLE